MSTQFSQEQIDDMRKKLIKVGKTTQIYRSVMDAIRTDILKAVAEQNFRPIHFLIEEDNGFDRNCNQAYTWIMTAIDDHDKYNYAGYPHNDLYDTFPVLKCLWVKLFREGRTEYSKAGNTPILCGGGKCYYKADFTRWIAVYIQNRFRKLPLFKDGNLPVHD